jgi:hypothetical protein
VYNWENHHLVLKLRRADGKSFTGKKRYKRKRRMRRRERSMKRKMTMV